MTRVAGVVAALLVPTAAHAIPAFSRAYQVSCATCHTAFPRRSEFGEAFLANGYRWPGADIGTDGRARNPVPLESRGASFWETQFPLQWPFGVVANMGVYGTGADNADNAVTLGSPSLSFVLGAALGAHLSYFGIWSPRSPPDELALVIHRPLWDRPEFSLRIGLLEPRTTAFKRNEALVGKFSISSASLNGFTLGAGRLGAEANGIVLGRALWAAGAVQSGPTTDFWDSYYSVSYRFGGIDYFGIEPDIDLDQPAGLDDLVLALTHWGYSGQTVSDEAEAATLVRRFGLDAKVRFRDANLWSGVMLGFDRNVIQRLDDRSATVFFELSYHVTPWLVPSYLVQYQDAESFTAQVQTHDVGIIVLPLENLRVKLRYGQSSENGVPATTELQLMFGS
jgi:hypothetical protein